MDCDLTVVNQTHEITQLMKHFSWILEIVSVSATTTLTPCPWMPRKEYHIRNWGGGEEGKKAVLAQRKGYLRSSQSNRRDRAEKHFPDDSVNKDSFLPHSCFTPEHERSQKKQMTELSQHKPKISFLVQFWSLLKNQCSAFKVSNDKEWAHLFQDRRLLVGKLALLRWTGTLT